MTQAGLEISGLSVEYPLYGEAPLRAVQALDLTVAPGEVLALVGGMGCGKTTLARAVMGALKPPGRIAAGSIRFAGQELTTLPEAKLRALRGSAIAMIVPNPRGELDPMRTVGEQICGVLRAHLGLSRRAARERALETLADVRIPDPLRRFGAYPHELSGGMAQRVVIAIALACQPRLLISDDATSGLDVTVQAQVLELLATLVAERGTAMLYITRDMGVAANFCDRIAVMHAGRIVEVARRDAFFNGPRHPASATLLAAFAHAPRLRERWARTEPGPAAPGGCGFAAQCVRAAPRCLAEAPRLLGDAHHASACHDPIRHAEHAA
jgi:oligopeptide/dipeptide ABC transporter ATP-binding protein